jgi:hypothetical protein
LLILLFKNVLKISNFEKSAKTSKNLKKQGKKTSNIFLLRRFYAGGKKFTNKKGLFYTKFFEFEEFSIEPFFCSSIQPQHTVFTIKQLWKISAFYRDKQKSCIPKRNMKCTHLLISQPDLIWMITIKTIWESLRI